MQEDHGVGAESESERKSRGRDRTGLQLRVALGVGTSPWKKEQDTRKEEWAGGSAVPAVPAQERCLRDQV